MSTAACALYHLVPLLPVSLEAALWDFRGAFFLGEEEEKLSCINYNACHYCWSQDCIWLFIFSLSLSMLDSPYLQVAVPLFLVAYLMA